MDCGGGMQARVARVPRIPLFQLPAFNCIPSFSQDELLFSITFTDLVFNMAFTDLAMEEGSDRVVKSLRVLVFLQHTLVVLSALGIASSTYLIALGPRDALALAGEMLLLAGVRRHV